MIKENDFRKGNFLHDREGNLCRVEILTIDEIKAPALFSAITKLPNVLILLTKEWFNDFGFEVRDMGDYWEFTKDDFQVIQLKIPLTDKVLDPVFILHSKKSKRIIIKYVHKLQNLYYEIEGKELILKKS